MAAAASSFRRAQTVPEGLRVGNVDAGTAAALATTAPPSALARSKTGGVQLHVQLVESSQSAATTSAPAAAPEPPAKVTRQPTQSELVASEKAKRAAASKNVAATMRRNALAFQEADVDGDQKLEFDEWVSMLPATMRERRTVDQLRQIFNVADLDGDGTISLDEFFLWTLSLAAMQGGTSAETTLQRFSKSGNGRLDELEFTKACEHLGMGEFAHELFAQLPKDASRTVSYRELLKQIETAEHSREMKNFVMAAAWEMSTADAALVTRDDLTKGWSFDGHDAESARRALNALLHEKGVKLSSLFVKMDTDKNNQLSKEEFFGAFRDVLGFEGPTRIMREIFNAIDSSADGVIGFEEFNAWLRGRRTMVLERRLAAKSLTFHELLADGDDVEWDEPRLRFEIAKLISDSGTHPTDVFQRYDLDGDGTLSKKEFLMGMKTLVVDPADPRSSDVWYEVVRSSVTDAFHLIIEREHERQQELKSKGIALAIKPAGEVSFDYVQFISWLDPKDTVSKRTPSAHTCARMHRHERREKPSAILVSLAHTHARARLSFRKTNCGQVLRR